MATLSRRQALTGTAAAAAASALPALPAVAHPAVSRPTDVTAMTTADLLAERQTACAEVWRSSGATTTSGTNLNAAASTRPLEKRTIRSGSTAGALEGRVMAGAK